MHELEIKHNRRLHSSRASLPLYRRRPLSPSSQESKLDADCTLPHKPTKMADGRDEVPSSLTLPTSFLLSCTILLALPRTSCAREDQPIRRRESFLSCLHSKTHCPRDERAAGDCRTDVGLGIEVHLMPACRGRGRPHSGKGFQDMHAVTPFSLHQVGSAGVLVCVDVSKVRIPCCGAVPALAGWLALLVQWV